MVHKSFRLQSSAFDRTSEEEKVKPKRVIFISVEGVDTEKNYFELLNKTLDNSVIKLEILKQRKHNAYSSPHKVLELLQEYLELRRGHVIPDNAILFQCLDDAYDVGAIEDILSRGEGTREFKKLALTLNNAGIDIAYRKYLKQVQSDDESDVFCIIIDRDSASHRRETIMSCIDYCNENDILFCISNPCFEFWLLLHVCDVLTEFADELVKIHKNEKVSDKHTFVSRELSQRAGHAKKIPHGAFQNKYLNNIRLAMTRAQSFAQEANIIVDSIGTNLPHLMEKILDDD